MRGCGGWAGRGGKDGVATAGLITVDGLLVKGVDKVARVLNGVLEVTHGAHAAPLAPQALLGRLGLVLQLAEPGLVWTGTHTQNMRQRRYDTSVVCQGYMLSLYIKPKQTIVLVLG